MKLRYINKQLLTVALIATVCSVAPISYANDNDEVSLSLESLDNLYRERINHRSLEIRNETERRTTILDQLDAIINDMDSLVEQQTDTENNTPLVGENLQYINDQIDHIEKNIKLNQLLVEELEEELKKYPRPSVWQAALGKSDSLQQHKQSATRRYLINAARKQQRKLQLDRQQLSQRQQALADYGTTMSNSISKIQGRTSGLLEKRKQLEHQLATISSEIVGKQDRLSQLKERAEQLAANPSSMRFGKQKKKLPDPIDGTLAKQFSDPKAKGLLKWDGILINAPLGETFNAVSDGLVVFADEIHGLGNVAIVDHGEGYMTLYGMAELLTVQTDQLLLAGDAIGTVGEPVGTGSSALYFEVRHNAQTLNPQDWLEMQRIVVKE